MSDRADALQWFRERFAQSARSGVFFQTLSAGNILDTRKCMVAENPAESLTMIIRSQTLW